MFKVRNTIILILILVLIALPLSGCNKNITIVNVKPKDFSTLDTDIIDSNDKYTLSWDNETKNVILNNTSSEVVWSTVPYDFSQSGETNINLNSPMFISYYNITDGSLSNAKAYSDCIELNNFSISSNEGKLLMNFYFEEAEILVPLEICLIEDGLQVNLKAEGIKESGKTRLIDVSFLPYLCSTPNSKDEDSYLFVPTGSGALLYTDEDVQDFSRTYTGEVYGTDGARQILDTTTKEEPIRLPVFGVKNHNSALFAIISNGAESAKITADAGNSRNGYSTVYTTFSLRGNDETEVKRAGYSDALVYSEKFDTDAVYSVNYYPLNDENADYSGMANFYKDYLKEKGVLIDSSLSQQPYSIEFLGGSMVRDVVMGVPYSRLQVSTTLKQVNSILEELCKETNSNPMVLLKGFCEDGLDTGRIAGGYNYSSKLGGNKEYKSLSEFCKEKNVSLFTEYDIVRFNTSSDGFSTSVDIAETASNQLAAFYPLRVSIRNQNKDLKKYGFIKRSLLEDVTDKLLKKCDYVEGISLTSLGSIAYSDFSNKEYYVKLNMSSQVQELIKKTQKEGHIVNVGAANGYAAQICDSITEVPLSHGDYFAFDTVVPFYQMVFHGYSAMYSTPINLSVDSTAELLRAIESGVSPSFVLSDDVDTVLAETQSGEYFASNYEGNKYDIKSIITNTSDFFEKVGDSSIVSHKIIDNCISITEFSDGTTVWVNHSKTQFDLEGMTLEKQSFLYKTNGEIKSFSLNGGEQ